MRTQKAVKATALLVAIGLGLVGCTDDSSTNAAGNAPDNDKVSSNVSRLVTSVCRGVSLIRESGSVNTTGLTAPTGIAASRRNPGIWWLNDNGQNSPRMWAIDIDGDVRAVIQFKNVKPFDWEDIAVATDASGNETVYLADIGDPAAQRTSIALHAFQAPDLSDSKAGGDPRDIKVDARTHEFTYPDGAHDSKAMFIDSSAGEFYLITNDPAGAKPGIYRGKLSEGTDGPDMLSKLEQFDKAPASVITGADFSPDGSAVVIRSAGQSWILKRQGNQVMAEVFEGDPCEAPSVTEAQGEAVGFAADGSLYVTVAAAPTLSRVEPPTSG